MKAVTRHIPNAITSLNLLFGCMSITYALSGNIVYASYFIFAAAICDFFDGFAARLLNAKSPIGLQLDSLADVVSFGVAPSMIMFEVMSYSFPVNYSIISFCQLVAFVPFLVAIFSAIRLAKFNIDTRQTESFIGLPTPACAIFIASAFIYATNNECGRFIFSPYFISIASIILSPLLIAEIPMFSLKVKKQASISAFVKKYAKQVFFLLLALVLIVIFQFGGLALTFLIYILLGVGEWLLNLGKTKV